MSISPHAPYWLSTAKRASTGRLAYVRTINYLSPSSFMVLESDPLDFYVQRLGPKELRGPREVQGFAAGVGSAFDDAIKCIWEGTQPQFENVECEERDRAIELGLDICDVYVRSGAWDYLCSEGQIVAMEDELDGFVPGTDVPIRGKLDTNWDGIRFQDFKVRGAGQILSGKKVPSPDPGYVREFRSGGLTKKTHKRSGEPLESLNRKWAIQGAVYHWLLNGKISQCAGAIDQLVPQPDGDVRICQYRTFISEQFQHELAAQFVDAWARIQECRVVNERIPLDLQLATRALIPWWKR